MPWGELPPLAMRSRSMVFVCRWKIWIVFVSPPWVCSSRQEIPPNLSSKLFTPPVYLPGRGHRRPLHKSPIAYLLSVEEARPYPLVKQAPFGFATVRPNAHGNSGSEKVVEELPLPGSFALPPRSASAPGEAQPFLQALP